MISERTTGLRLRATRVLQSREMRSDRLVKRSGMEGFVRIPKCLRPSWNSNPVASARFRYEVAGSEDDCQKGAASAGNGDCPFPSFSGLSDFSPFSVSESDDGGSF